MDEQAAPFAYPYTLSSNPPNPRSQSTLFRQGDWLCPHAHCNVHNFSRNVACISCGSPRPPHVSQLPPTPAPPPHIPPFAHWQQQPQQQQQQQQAHSHQSSPRFTSPPISPTVQLSLAQQSPALAVVQQMAASAPKGQSLLTPSGRSFSVGGKVQNISNDPLSPCILFWPDNEPFPEQGQIRPPMTGGVQPPILNTGNKGPIEHQVCERRALVDSPGRYISELEFVRSPSYPPAFHLFTWLMRCICCSLATGFAILASTTTGGGARCARCVCQRVSQTTVCFCELTRVYLSLL